VYAARVGESFVTYMGAGGPNRAGLTRMMRSGVACNCFNTLSASSPGIRTRLRPRLVVPIRSEIVVTLKWSSFR
jgi:hypothetical protein